MSRGDVILVEVPFRDLSGSKVRPALVVGSNARTSPDVIIASIRSGKKAGATRAFLDLATEAGRRSGRLHDSMIQCENLVTIDRVLVRRKRDDLSAALMPQVDACLRSALGLP